MYGSLIPTPQPSSSTIDTWLQMVNTIGTFCGICVHILLLITVMIVKRRTEKWSVFKKNQEKDNYENCKTIFFTNGPYKRYFCQINTPFFLPLHESFFLCTKKLLVHTICERVIDLKKIITLFCCLNCKSNT